jgi:hypothetical protein
MTAAAWHLAFFGTGYAGRVTKMTYEEQVRRWAKAVRTASKEVLSSKKKTLNFIVKRRAA